MSYRGQLSYDADEWGGSINHLLVGADFNPEIGFVRRKDFRQTSGTVRFGPRPESVPWIRQLTFQVEGNYLENERLGYVESKSWGGQFGAELENGDRLNVSYANAYEGFLQPERISGALVPAGRYDNPEVRGQLLGRPSAPRVGQRVLPQGRLLRRHSHGRGSESLAYRGHAAALGRAQRLLPTGSTSRRGGSISTSR